jgi:tRNA1Val (adenine37-N6)-methyltransferase
MAKSVFQFKQFAIHQDRCAMKVSTDGVLFGAWVRHAGAARILDIGAGTGLLAIIAAQRNTVAHVDAVEIDDAAAAQAAENVAACPWSDRIRVHRMDIRRLRATERYDLILCNPPYYSGYSGPADERVGVAKHSNELQLGDLVEAMEGLLADEGRAAVIIPLSREREFMAIATGHGLFVQRRCAVRYVAHRPAKRVMLELGRREGPLEEEEMIVEASGPFDYTPQYRRLIADLLPGF